MPQIWKEYNADTTIEEPVINFPIFLTLENGQ